MNARAGQMLDPFRYRLPEELIQRQEGPCLSLYQPTLRGYPDSQQNPIRYRNLLRELRSALDLKFPDSHDRETVLGPFEDLARDGEFWRFPLDGLAVFGNPGLFRVYRLQRRVPERAIAAGDFHLKPLRRIFQTADRYQLLGLSRNRIRLFEGTGGILDEIKPAAGVPGTMEEALGSDLTSPHLTVASYGGAGGQAMHHGHGGKPDQEKTEAERFFRVVDRAVYEHHTRPTGLPLVLAALPEHHSLFHRISKNPYLLEGGVRGNPIDQPAEDLGGMAWRAIEPYYSRQLEAQREAYEQNAARGLGSDDPARVSEAAAAGRVELLLVEAERRVAGRLDEETGKVEPVDPGEPGADDLLDDLADLVERRGGRILVVPPDRMPSATGIAAVYRY